ncbi:hypothetical protein [Krasilnikovia sp. MM14-A1259]|uniref:hypothetical protein n=1 Tax=Krasilnikovia sp. MM14-A1259 TaxID=3373539 RepID=UPI003803E0DC
MSDHLWPDFPDDPGHHDPGLPGEHHDDAGLPDVFDPGFDHGHDSGWGLDDGHDHDPGYDDAHDLGHDPGHEHHAGHDHDTAAPEPGDHHDAGQENVDPPADPHLLGHVGTDPDAWDDTGADPAGVFPPALDVGPLPEPVDGFPWIDTGSLGLVDPAAVHLPVEHPDAAGLAAYAGADLPPGADPWQALADSDDPATSALARWWRHDT